MNIGYVKKEEHKRRENCVYNVLNSLRYYIHKITNKVWQDKKNSNVFYANNFNEKSIEKLKIIFEKNKIDYVIVQNDADIGYRTLSGNKVIKYMLPEMIKDILEKIKPKTEQISICVNKYNDENINIIEDIARSVKTLKVVTNNEWFDQLESRLEKEEIYISVTNNTRTALKSSCIVVNIDYQNLEKFNINRNIIIIDISNNLKISKSFNGIVIKSIDINTKKVMRDLEEFIDFNRSKLIEAEILKCNNYEKVKNKIKDNKIQIINYKNKRIINSNEFERIRKMNEKVIDKKLDKKLNESNI